MSKNTEPKEVFDTEIDVSETDNKGFSPFQDDVKGVQTLEEHLSETADFEDADIPDLDGVEYEQEEGAKLGDATEGIADDFEDNNPESDEDIPLIETEDYEDRHSFKLGKVIIEGLHFFSKEIVGKSIKIDENFFYELEISDKYSKSEQNIFRSLGYWNKVVEHNAKQKDRLGFTKEELSTCVRLLNKILDKYEMNVELGPEGEFLFEIAKVGYRNYNLAQEIKAENKILMENFKASIQELLIEIRTGRQAEEVSKKDQAKAK